MKVEDLIHSRSEVYSITEDVTVYDAARYLREKQVRSVGVIKPGGKLVGVISISDVVRATVSDKEFLIEQLTKYISGA